MILLVLGSPGLTDTPAARRWTQDALAARIERPVLVVSGRARGPDQWAGEEASAKECEALAFGQTGYLEHFMPGAGWYIGPERWTESKSPGDSATREAWRQWFLARDRAMVEWACEQEGELRCLVFVAPWSISQETDEVARYAEAVGIKVERLVCPRELGPEATRG